MEHRRSLAPSVMAPLDESAAPSDAFDGRTEFQREQDRLIQEIAQDFQEVLTGANAYNRRIDEALGVGHGFKLVASLWGRFGELMRQVQPEVADSVADVSSASNTR